MQLFQILLTFFSGDFELGSQNGFDLIPEKENSLQPCLSGQRVVHLEICYKIEIEFGLNGHPFIFIFHLFQLASPFHAIFWLLNSHRVAMFEVGHSHDNVNSY